ncbi:hypothetical protein OESDEN_25070 [Oesophagostomum dentatum]|uniref:Glycosyl hydrolase family 30 beta sandwich domain-containing protein n=1 Tax=Oesophagostomum dentatum TaxID=61180 RepID=A0A0B1RRP3_OESDE|nr:hypothetical protein OESDEN_25070 [Oesophagostomum dentatum]
MFYAMGHFSKFIKPDSVRISAKVTGKQSVLATAFTYQGRRMLVLLNRHDSSQDLLITDSTTEHHIRLTVDPRSLVTVLWDKQ